MKKIILSAAILAGLAFVSCNKDDDKDNNCVKCTVSFEGASQAFDVCKASNGNASVGGQDTGVAFDTYVTNMCD